MLLVVNLHFSELFFGDLESRRNEILRKTPKDVILSSLLTRNHAWGVALMNLEIGQLFRELLLDLQDLGDVGL